MKWWAVAALALWLVWPRCGGSPGAPLTLGSFNIRFFPEPSTDPARVAERLAELDVDAVAVQEIIDPVAFEAVLARASSLTGRDYGVTLSRYCTRKYEMYLGVVFDRKRLELREGRALSTQARCRQDHPSAHLAVLRHGERRVGFVAIHLKAGGDADNHHRRRGQWRQVVATYAELERELGIPVVFAGDFNSTGMRFDGAGERSYIDRMVRAAGLELPTRALPCTAYYHPHEPAPRYAPSNLDHFLSRRHVSRPRVLGMCRALACKPQPDGAPPEDFASVSDHCPIAVDLP
jgi:endonuclease/exonuclease/phosphatase family metal-dependent hydrolase